MHRHSFIFAVVVGLFGASASVLASGPADPVLGFTAPNVNVRVAFSQPGRVKKVNIEEGQQVVEGAAIASLEDAELVASQAIAKIRSDDRSEVDAAMANRDSIALRLSDLRDLLESGGASREEVRRVETELAVAEANVKTAEAEQAVQVLEVSRLETLRELRRLKAPLAGHVKEIFRRAGEYVSVNAPEVVEIVQLDPLKVVFHLPQAEARKLVLDQPLTVRLPELARNVEATVRRVSPLVDPESGTTEVEMTIANHDLNIQSGLRCHYLGPTSDSLPQPAEKRAANADASDGDADSTPSAATPSKLPVLSSAGDTQ